MMNKEELLNGIKNKEVSESEIEQILISKLKSMKQDVEVLAEGLGLMMEMAENREINLNDELELQLIQSRLQRLLGDTHELSTFAQSKLKEAGDDHQEGLQM